MRPLSEYIEAAERALIEFLGITIALVLVCFTFRRFTVNRWSSGRA